MSEYTSRSLSRETTEGKLSAFEMYCNRYRVHSGIYGIPPEQEPGQGHHQPLPLTAFRWESHCHGLFQLPAAPQHCISPTTGTRANVHEFSTHKCLIFLRDFNGEADRNGSKY